MRHLFILMLALLAVLPSCQTTVIPEGPWVKKIDSEELSRLVINFSAKMEREKHLFLEDSYASYDDSIKKICIKYSSQKLLTLKEARLLIVELVEEFLYRLNNNSVLGFELETFPFTAHNLNITINFESFFGMYVDPLYIGQIWLQAGCVDFYAFDRKNNDIDWDHHRFEPYFKSRELALLQKEADLPYEEIIENPPKRPSEYIYDRYTPYGPGRSGMHPHRAGHFEAYQPVFFDRNMPPPNSGYPPGNVGMPAPAVYQPVIWDGNMPIQSMGYPPVNPGMSVPPVYQDVNVLRD